MGRLQFSEAARRDLVAIADFIAGNSPLDAARFMATLETHCRLLASRPLAGRPRPELAPDGADIVWIIHSARDLRRALAEPN